MAVPPASGRLAERTRQGAWSCIALSPLERPDPGLVAAAAAAGALGVLDLGRDSGARARALAALIARGAPIAVRVPDGVDLDGAALPAAVEVVVVGGPGQVAAVTGGGRAVIAQVTSLDEARAARGAGADALIAKGSEAGGRVGEETAFVLAQRLIAEGGLPIWVQGGIGLHTAAACAAGGAAGVVIDVQLALVRESSLSVDVRAAIAAMDGSETTVLAGHRCYTRPDLPVAQLAGATVDAVRARLGGDDLVAHVLPLGQEAAFARGFARRFTTAAGVIAGLRLAVDEHVAAAAALAPLGPDAPLAAAHGVRYPIAQGPMSRVSDRAAFAEAVARAGGLPFLALSLMPGPEVRELLLETRAACGDRPWGVGILGFVPPEMREQQLAVLREVPPPVALIAGGRPSQATPLEAQGTATYLHVPSPGLLDLFLRDGARRFVFEGRECGGHVGPRSSFALWEAQLERLLAHPAPGELSVLFAGGIHDARSAAMVAAMAAPLAARGARVGVLMGTAYLFTEEAVAAGAIQPGFQDAAIACERTVLLETAPGHATRCADTAFADAFADERRRLEEGGVAAQERWAALEQLNLGRLRIAAKGLRRDGGAVVAIDAAAQREQGMYMIGQVAALRHARTTIAALHAEVSEGGTALLRAQAAALAARESAPVDTADVAIVGLASIFPGAPDTDAFWANILAGEDAIREVPPERWSADTYYDPAATGADAGVKTPCKWGGFLDDVRFDPLSYGIPPRSLAAIEPVQLLALEVARRALADAGYLEREHDRARTSVIFGAEAGTDLSSAYNFRALYPHYAGALPAELDAALPRLSEDSFPGVLSNVIAGRIANRLDLGGVNYTVDAACASSLAAVDLACKELAAGTSDMVLCGGADLHNSINDYLLFASVHALSPTGKCHTFDASADGIVLGEGVACLVLKRVADAERDGDRIYAVIKGVAGGSDGKSLGLTAPRKEGQVRALERAYERAGVSPAAVGLVEAHGTGTVVGDRTELATLTEVYGRAGARPASCVLGSVKSQIGHTKCTAGLAGLIKAALAIHHRVLPPTINLQAPNPAWDRETSPFVFLDAARPWTGDDRLAAVSAFGFGGTNFHAVLAAHAGSSAAGNAWPSELFVCRGADRAAALARVDRVLAGAPSARLRDLARTVSAAGGGAVQVAIVADSVDDLRVKLERARAGQADKHGVAIAPERPLAADGQLAFLCPGQGSQRPGMLAELFVAFPRLERWLRLGARWRDRMFPPAAFGDGERKAQAAALTDTRVAQPALGIADRAVAELLIELGVQPAMTAGHSYGELAALGVAGAIGDADLLALSAARGEAILAAAGSDPGAMVAVGADAALVAATLASCEGVVIANHNSPRQSVLSGPTPAIEAALVELTRAGIAARRIPVACAFHSPVVAAAEPALAATLRAMAIAPPRVPVWSNVTAAPYPDDADGVRALLAAQVAAPVKFAPQIEAMYAAGARVFVETGPGQVLTRLVGEILGDRPHVAIACEADPAAGVRSFLRALAILAVHGVAIDAEPLFRDRDATIVALEPDKPAARAQQHWLVNGHRARPEHEPAPPPRPAVAIAAPLPALPATSPALPAAPPSPSMPMTKPPPAAAHAPARAAERDTVVLEFLRTMRSTIAAQRDVMLSYLGSAVPAPVIEVVEAAPAVVAAPAPVIAAPAPAAAPAAPVAALDLTQLAVTIVSERTGYPADVLGLDLDLEADLSIDSIKRIEIIGELAARLGLAVKGAADGDAMVEELATRKTLRALVTWLEVRLASGAPAAPSTPLASAAPAPAPVVEVAPPPSTIRRFTLDVVPAPAPANGFTRLVGHTVVIAGGGEVGARLAARLETEGAVVRLVGTGAALAGGALDTLVHLGALDGERDPIAGACELFERTREALSLDARAILVATAGGGDFGRGGGAPHDDGAAGFVRSLAAEHPELRARAVDLDPAAGPDALAAQLHAELHAADPLVDVGYPGGVRSTLTAIAAAPPAGPEPALDAGSVVLITGGARGITAQVAIELARRTGCHLELVGRSPAPADEDPALAGAADAPALRKLLLERGEAREPAAIEARVQRILGDREIRATLAAIRDRGAQVTYHACDVRTPAFADVIASIYARHGRLDGVIHGAGVVEDKLVRHKAPASFERVVATKLAGAHTLARALRPDVGFVVFFASVSGAFGNRGQTDYAAANDALDRLAWSLGRRLSGRVVSIDWGPWAGAGMVSPALAREYARRGVELIAAGDGVDAMLAELRGGGPAQVILTAADPRAFARAAAPADAAVADVG